MSPKVGIILMNYNLPVETDYVYEKLVKNLTKSCYDYEICVVDNSSDKAPPSKYTTIRTIVNTRTMGAILLGAHYFTRKEDVEYLFFMHNDMDFEDSPDLLDEMITCMEWDKNIAVIHPSLNPAGAAVPIGDGNFVARQGTSGLRRVQANGHNVIPMDDTSPILVRKDDWNLVGGQDPRLSRCYSSGRDFYTALHRRGKSIWISDDITIVHKGQYTYSKQVGDESYQTLDREAGVEERIIMEEKYGPNWRMMFS